VHFLLFNNIEDTYIDTILTYPSLHILYFLISLLISEHLLNYIQRRKSKINSKHGITGNQRKAVTNKYRKDLEKRINTLCKDNPKAKQNALDEDGKIIKNPSESKKISDGREKFWDEKTKTIVIKDPNHKDGGTVFKTSKRYYDKQ
jgi:hypothetical protein